MIYDVHWPGQKAGTTVMSHYYDEYHGRTPYSDTGAEHTPYYDDSAYYDDRYPHQTRAKSRKPGFQKLVNLCGAIVSFALVFGMIFWAWQLATRDLSGVPVIQALEMPMRVRPDDPGGMQVPNQGLAVNEIAGGGNSDALPDQVVLAPAPVELNVPTIDPIPQQPQEISSQVPDQPGGFAAPVAFDSVIDLSDGDVTPVQDPATVNLTGDPGIGQSRFPSPRPIETAQAVRAAQTAQPQNDQGFDMASAIAAAVFQAQSDQAPQSIGGVGRSLRPRARPGSVRISSASVADFAPDARAGQIIASDPTPARSLIVPEIETIGRDTRPARSVVMGDGEIPERDLAPGTRLVQLGAFDTRDMARNHWDGLVSQYPDHFADRSLVVQQATAGGQTFYRLRAHGFENLAQARGFCDLLTNHIGTCIPVSVR
jgi:hypothetical protein